MSVMSVHRFFHRFYPNQTAPDKKSILQWLSRGNGDRGEKSRPGRPRISEENVDYICQSCVREPKEIQCSTRELHIPKTTIQNGVLHLTTISRYVVMHYMPAFQTVGLVEQLPFPGLQEVPTLLLWISFKTLSMQKRFRIRVEISAVITAFTPDMIERTVHEVVNRL